MIRLIGIVLSIGFADSLNPSTIAPALLLAAGTNPRRQVAEFTLGVFVVYFLGGLLIALGPGKLVIALVPHPSHNTVQILEVIAGAVLIAAGVVLWRFRLSLAQKRMPAASEGKRSAWMLGATIMAVELPTAFPYFGAIAAIVGSDRPIPEQVLLILLFNLCFIAPLLAILAVLIIAGDRADAMLTRGRDFLQSHWPVLLAAVALFAGAIVITLGLTGIIHRTHLIQRGRDLFS